MTSVSFETSQRIAMPPISRATLHASSASMSATMTISAPAAANLRARARPMPRAPPVTTTTRSATSMGDSVWGLAYGEHATGESIPRGAGDGRGVMVGYVVHKFFFRNWDKGWFPRRPIANRITPHGRWGTRLQRALSACYRVDRETLDGGGRQSLASQPRTLQPTPGGHTRHQ